MDVPVDQLVATFEEYDGYVEAGDLTVATAGDPRMSVQLEDKVSSTNVAYVAQVR